MWILLFLLFTGIIGAGAFIIGQPDDLGEYFSMVAGTIVLSAVVCGLLKLFSGS